MGNQCVLRLPSPCTSTSDGPRPNAWYADGATGRAPENARASVATATINVSESQKRVRFMGGARRVEDASPRGYRQESVGAEPGRRALGAVAGASGSARGR